MIIFKKDQTERRDLLSEKKLERQKRCQQTKEGWQNKSSY